MIKLVLLCVISLKVAVSKNLLTMLNEDLLYINSMQKLFVFMCKMESYFRLRKLSIGFHLHEWPLNFRKLYTMLDSLYYI